MITVYLVVSKHATGIFYAAFPHLKDAIDWMNNDPSSKVLKVVETKIMLPSSSKWKEVVRETL